MSRDCQALLSGTRVMDECISARGLSGDLEEWGIACLETVLAANLFKLNAVLSSIGLSVKGLYSGARAFSWSCSRSSSCARDDTRNYLTFAKQPR